MKLSIILLFCSLACASQQSPVRTSPAQTLTPVRVDTLPTVMMTLPKTQTDQAEKVRDVAWAAAPDFRWDATSWNGILSQAYYEWPKAGKAWEAGAEQTQWTIRNYSETFFPYPYPQATSVAGPVGGMEYPMFVMVHAGELEGDCRREE